MFVVVAAAAAAAVAAAADVIVVVVVVVAVSLARAVGYCLLMSSVENCTTHPCSDFVSACNLCLLTSLQYVGVTWLCGSWIVSVAEWLRRPPV